MAVFSRRPPRRARAMLARDERVLAWARAGGSGASAGASGVSAGSSGASAGSSGDSWVIATTLGLWLPGRAERLGWHQIHKATWDSPRLTVIPSTQVADGDGYAVMADDTPVEVELPDPGDVPVRVRERVTRSVVYTRHHALDGGGVRVVGRRVPGANGLSWHVRYDEGTDADDAEIQSATAALCRDALQTLAVR